MPSDLHHQLRTLVLDSRPLMEILRAVRRLALPDWFVAAGAVRSRVWDSLTGRVTPIEDSDIDVVFFDKSDLSPAHEQALEARLRQALPLHWELRNQARMHRRNGDAPYQNSEEAMRHWLETPTAVGVRLEADDRLTLAAPFGLEDLFSLTLRPTARGHHRLDAFHERLKNKGWQERWPELRVVV